MPSPLPPQCAAKFRAEKLLASGGFGSVWLAVQETLDRQVAVKVLHHETLQDQEALERFKNEARITASLNHPNIVKIIDHGVDGGIPWIAYEYVPGQSLREPVKAGGMPWPAALSATLQIAAALGEAHAQGILHRDIKPDNVLESEAGHYKVADFGIAKWSAGSAVKTQVGVVLGTPAYLSPQQVSGPAASPQSDLYALGVLLFELLTGRVPFYSESLPELLRLHKVEPAPRPSQFAPAVPAGVDAIVRRLLAKTREERYATAAELTADLERTLAGAPAGVPAPRPPPRALASGTATRPVRDGVPSLPASRASAGGTLALAAATALLTGGIWLALHHPWKAPPLPSPEPPPPSAVSLPKSIVSTADGSTMILIEAGVLKTHWTDPKPQSLQQRVSAFYMDRLEVTNQQFATFLRATGRPPHERDPQEKGLAGPDHPVIGVRWDEAVAYCAWAGKRLPTEVEWEWAASGKDQRTYPWGEHLSREHPQANFKDEAFGKSNDDLSIRGPLGNDGYAETAPVGSFPSGATPEGVLDLAGNVAEWCADAYVRDQPRADGIRERVVRGGSWYESERWLVTHERRAQGEDVGNRDIGFRGVRNVPR